MANALLRLPQFEGGAGRLDFSPINSALDFWNRRQQQDIQNKRADEQLGIQRAAGGRAQQAFDEQQRQAKVQEIGRMAGYADSLKPDDPRRQQIWGQIINSSPNMAGALKQYGMDPADHINGPRFLMAQAGQYDPQGQAQAAATLRLTQAQADKALADAEHARRQGNAATGLVPIWGTDAKGNPVIMQPTKDGRLVQSGVPQGVTPMPPEMIVARKKDAEVRAKAQAEARANLPLVESSAKSMLDMIDGVVGNKEAGIPEHPALGRFTGYQGIAPNVTLSARDLQTRLDQIGGKAFLEAFNSLRGGGQITEAEGRKATLALSRLEKTTIGSDAYKRAATDLRNEVNRLVMLARKKAGVGDRLSQSAPGGDAPAQPASTSAPVRVTTPDEAMKLAPGTVFMTPDGRLKVRP